jgi:NAD(P)H-hydrate epimerase
LVQALAPELLAYSIDRLPDRYNVLLIGPGLGDLRRLRVRHVEEALGGDTPLVLDADGLNAIGLEMLERIGVGGDRVLTPHAGEFHRLTGIPRDAIGLRDMSRVALQANSTVLLKGNPSYVSDGSTPWLINSNGPELASIGTGDVLAGMVAALMARGLDPATAARSAAYWHGAAAADMAKHTTVTADELARYVGRYAWEKP